MLGKHFTFVFILCDLVKMIAHYYLVDMEVMY